MKMPQSCPECKTSLADPGVTPGYDKDLFSLVLTKATTEQGQVYVCPSCKHEWAVDPKFKEKRKAFRRKVGSW